MEITEVKEQVSQKDKANIFGEYMKSLRESVGLLPKTAAQKFGVTEEALLRWESGTELPPREFAKNISLVFKISAREWLGCLDCETEIRNEFGNAQERKNKIQ